jgi:hypothetical protein
MVSMRDGALVDDVVLPSDVTTAAEILSASRE